MIVTNPTERGTTNGTSPNRSQEIHEHMQMLAGRDLQLLSITLLMLLVLAGGLAALVYPHLIALPKDLNGGIRLLPQLFFGLIVLILLFNVYIILQKRELSSTRRRLIEELIFNERMEAVSLVDPTTQLYNRRAMQQMVSHEVVRSNRQGSDLSVMVIDICDFDAISKKLGTAESEQFLYEAAQLVKNTLRGSDMLFRYNASQFLALMPDTSEQKVDFAIKRLEGEVGSRNADRQYSHGLRFTYGVAQYAHRSRINDTLFTAERKAFLSKNNFAEVF